MTRLLPIATTLLAVLLSIEPLHITGYAALTPAFTLMAVYHWTIYRPDLLPPLALFAIGLVQDLLSGGPPGITPLLLLLGRQLLLRGRQHLMNRPFPFVWAGFAVFIGVATAFSWAAYSLLAARLLNLRGPVFCAVLTISVFPIASFLLGRSQRAFAARRST